MENHGVYISDSDTRCCFLYGLHSEAGTYFVSELINSSRQVTSWGIVRMVRGKIRNLFQGQPDLESTTMGVCAKEMEEDPGFEWMDEEEEAVDQGKALLGEHRYEEAVGCFEEVLELFDPFLQRFPDHENSQSVCFLSAFCNSQIGRKAEAKAKLQKAYALNPSSETGRRAEYMLGSL